jgi:aspartate-semialdehyde dehydrogenase
MSRRIEVGILGATGMVGQQFIEFVDAARALLVEAITPALSRQTGSAP